MNVNVSSLINPINMPQATPAAPYALQAAGTPANGYNTPVDGFVTRTIFGGIEGKNMAKLIFEKANPGSQGLAAITKNAYVKQAALSVGVGLLGEVLWQARARAATAAKPTQAG